MVKNKNLEVAAVVCEIGILGSFIGNEKEIIANRTAGYLCRTKKFFEGEGGVASGYAVIDSIMHPKNWSKKKKYIYNKNNYSFTS